MGFYRGPNIVTDDLKLALDAGSERSYSGSGTSANSIVGTNTATLYNGVAYSSDNGGYWDLDGSDDYILTDFGNGLNPTTQDLSYGIWVKPDLAQTRMFIMQSDWSDNRRFYVGSINQKLGWGIQAKGWNANDTDLTFENGKWYYINIVFSGTTAKLYADGVLKATITISSYTFNRNLTISSGNPFSQSYYWNGGIAACRVYYQALTAAEVLQNYNAQKSRFGL
jgi:hypothetical protein